jgi:hypothetical protein
MTAKKPDCTGQRFGRLTVISKSGRCPKTHRDLWRLLCDCGKQVERTRNSFDRKSSKTPSCGCERIENNLLMSANRRKPDCTGQKFGLLVVLGKGDRVPDRGSFRQLWRLQCDCGRVIEKPRGDFEYNKQISCGCARGLGLVDNKRRPMDITGERFGTLTAVNLTGKKVNDKPTWLLRCDCGNVREMSLTMIRHYEYYGTRINCRSRSKHIDICLTYPVTPSPYPQEAGELLIKYLHLTELNYQKIDAAVEDEKRDRLIRAAWILTYRRSLGEEISELHEARYMRKSLLYCSINVFWKRKIEQHGGFLYTVTGSKKQIGDVMTNATSNDYPVIETSGITIMLSANPTSSHLKFRRC